MSGSGYYARKGRRQAEDIDKFVRALRCAWRYSGEALKKSLAFL